MPVPEAIAAAMRQTNELFNTEVGGKHDIAALDKIYTAGARILPPGAPMIEGREAIKAFWTRAVAAMDPASVTLASVHAEQAGDGVVETVVTVDDVKKPMPDREAHQNALWELGIPAENALAIAGSASGLRSATSAGLATVVITGDGTPDLPAAMAVRPDYVSGESLSIADCQRLHGSWWAAHKRTAA